MAAATKSAKKETNTKRSASKMTSDQAVDRSKVTETNASIERIALFGEGSETGAKF